MICRKTMETCQTPSMCSPYGGCPLQSMTLETEREIYEAVLRRIGDLMGAKPGAKEGAELDFLTTVAESYEERNFPMGGRS